MTDLQRIPIEAEPDDWWNNGFRYDEEDFHRCSCRYCHCMNEVEGGGICGECYMGAHQG